MSLRFSYQINSILVAITFILIISPKQTLGGGDFSGEIIFTDSSTVKFTRIFNYVGGFAYDSEILTFSKNPDGSVARSVHFDVLSRIDFLGPKPTVKTLSGQTLRKATLSFIDSTVYDNICLNNEAINWFNPHESGSTVDALSIVFDLKEAKLCRQCSRRFTQSDWKFCPYDGTEL